MQALYLDTVDMSCIIRSGPSESSSTTEEAPSSTNGAAAGLPAAATGLPVSRPIPPTLFEEATELYQVRHSIVCGKPCCFSLIRTFIFNRLAAF